MIEEELFHLQEENRVLRERLLERDAMIEQLQGLLKEQNSLMEHQWEQTSQLSTQVKTLQDRLSKDSHNSHLPPSSDRLTRKPNSLCKKSEKKSGGQPGHPGIELATVVDP